MNLYVDLGEKFFLSEVLVCPTPEELESDSRFKERTEDPFGEWECSPDGENTLIEKMPSEWPVWARWAKRVS
ncbi:MAG: hypothetical protein ACPLSN_09505, partial [Dictyoglomus turgidum]